MDVPPDIARALAGLPVARLTEEFRKVALRLETGLELTAHNRAMSQIVWLAAEMKRRTPDGRRELAPLLHDASGQVRLSAAVHLLSLAPHQAAPILQDLATLRDSDIGFSARQVVEAWRKGLLVIDGDPVPPPER